MYALQFSKQKYCGGDINTAIGFKKPSKREELRLEAGSFSEGRERTV